MDEEILQLATRIIREANVNGVPADEQMRLFFKRNPGFIRERSGDISRAIYTFYRWSGFANPKDSLPAKVRFANNRAAEYVKNPSTFSLKALKHAVPRWLEREMELTYEWLSAIQVDPVIWLRARKGEAEGLRERMRIQSEPIERFPEAIAYDGTQDLYRHADQRAGNFQIQDISSQIVSHLCDPKPGATWWDACAGEGGKTLHLSDLMANKGLIWATDRSKRRLAHFKKRAAKAKAFNVRLREWDGSANLPTKTQFDGVLVDAPCSGVGTWQRKPHARWTTTANDVKELADVQEKLLSNVARSVKRGGKLVYAVCTLTQKETTAVADAFAKRFPEFEPLEMPAMTEGGDPAAQLTILPHHFRGNGMFVAAWRRRNESDLQD